MRYDDLPHDLNVATYFIDRNLEEGRGGATALITPDETVTYTELADRVRGAAHALRSVGVRRGDHVLLALSDGVDFVATWYGAQRIGAVTAEVYTFLPTKDYEYFLDYVRPAAVVVDPVTLPRMREASGGRHRFLVAGAAERRDGEFGLAERAADAPSTVDPAPTTKDDVAIWKFTTGSTGAPKACVHPVASPVLSHHNYARGVLDLGPGDVVLPVPKLFFGYARDLAALYPFGVGGTGIAFGERTTAERIFELVARHRPTILVNVPTMMSAMVAHPEASAQDLSCLRLATSAGEALPAELHRKWDETFGVEVVDGIGSSEAYHIYLSNRPGAGRRGTCGQAVPGYLARVVGDDGFEVPAGEVGTLEVTGGTVAREYVGDAEKSAATFRRGTVHTGDLFSRDADGYFTYHGRADDLLKVGGIWVAPGEIEHCLVGHPDVVECGVVGHETDGLVRTRAYVVLRAGAAATEEGLREYVGARLSGHKRPHEIVFAADLPRTTNGKLDRRALRELS
ncbi:MAG TPA: benzoate-CoA ligase family protein [Actinophytocola sp.]|nr:benzoate-CoA ligase family protein [Actinophytocola sp.]